MGALLVNDNQRRLYPVEALRGMEANPPLVSAPTTGTTLGEQIALPAQRSMATSGMKTTTARGQSFADESGWGRLRAHDVFGLILCFLPSSDVELMRCCTRQ